LGGGGGRIVSKVYNDIGECLEDLAKVKCIYFIRYIRRRRNEIYEVRVVTIDPKTCETEEVTCLVKSYYRT